MTKHQFSTKGGETGSKMIEDDAIQYAIDNGIINMQEVFAAVNDMKRRELLAKHPYSIWQNKDGKWLTYLYDDDGKKHEVFDEDETLRVISYLRKNADIWNLGLLLQFQTGMRIGEIAALQRECE